MKYWTDRLADYSDVPLGSTPASEAEIRRQEQRLGRRLPPSYREFLQVSEGWDVHALPCVHLLPITAIGWLRDVDPHLANYGNATPKPGSTEIHDLLAHTMQISENVEGQVYLLNPHVVTADGEWEAWYLDTLEGFDGKRFRSFRDLMEDAFRGH
ncbi:SMI1/KNR4 family protein [Herbidospora cretacea]|uniref:SMI1/KNR4 family protein n=1 Tax=Herbidospora cretacea TaxID=28444 RepID=UPI00068DAB64|nr:SMI1/KNR4 family protein [Herbidospora cretacea]